MAYEPPPPPYQNSDPIPISSPILEPNSKSILNSIPFLPPTPPHSEHSSPTFTDNPFRFQSTTISTFHPHNQTSQSIQLHEHLPSRRHPYEMPTTSVIPQHSHFPSTFGTSLPLIQPEYQHHRSSSLQSHWDGTLSATLTASLNRFRNLLFDSEYTTISTQSEPFPFSSQARSFISFTIRRIFTDPISQLSRSSIRFGLLCCFWYGSSALSSNTGKAILNRFKYPITLTIVQFGFVAIWCALFISIREGLVGKRFSGIKSKSLGGFWGIKKPNKSTVHGTLIMSLFSITGHIFSSMAIARVPVSTVHTIKALSPLFTVIAYAGLFGVRYGFATYFSLLPLTLGVMLACSFDLRANGTGFLCALGSTIIFVSQNIYGKKLLPQENDESKGLTNKSSSSSNSNGKMDKLNLLFYSSAIAFLLMIPIWIWFDLITIFKLWLDPISNLNLSANNNQNSTSSSLMFYFFCNGTVHFTQCILAFSILSRTSPVTYSIASLIKRIAVICIAIIWFGQPVSSIQAFGMLLTFSGLYIYNQSKSSIDKGELKRGKFERKHDLLLPRTQLDVNDLSLNNSESDEDPIKSYRKLTTELKPTNFLPLTTNSLQSINTTNLATSTAHRVHNSPKGYNPNLSKYQSGSVSSTKGLPSVFKPVPVR